LRSHVQWRLRCCIAGSLLRVERCRVLQR
jgi:hypothetical protein